MMDVALMSMVMSYTQTQQQASLSVMDMAMGNQKQQGQDLKKLIDSGSVTAIQRAAQPHLGSNLDLKG